MASIRSILGKLKHPVKRSSELRRLLRVCHKFSPFYTSGFLSALKRGVALHKNQGFSSEEIERYVLLNPDLSHKDLLRFISKKKLISMQGKLNPRSWSRVTEDKALFYRYFEGLGLAVPHIYALFFRCTPGFCTNGKFLCNRKDWFRFLEEDLPGEFVIKPSRGVLGKNIGLFSRKNRIFKDAHGQIYQAGDVYNTMAQDPLFDRFVIQQRLKNHPEILRLTGNPLVQTMRIITFTDKAGECRILVGGFRILVGENVIDNFSSGRSGNLMAPIDLDTGELGPAKAREANGIIRDIRRHSKTGELIQGFNLPQWKRCRALIENAAIKMLPIRTIGWDVALTPRGPVIVEANMWWNPPNIYGYGRTFFHLVEKELGAALKD